MAPNPWKVFDQALEKEYRMGQLNQARFLPRTAVQSLVTKDRLAGPGLEIPHDLLTFTCSEAPIIFLILWDRFRHYDFIKLLRIFRDAHFTDANLPLLDFRSSCKEFKFGAEECNHPKALDAFHDEDWEDADIGTFLEGQWKFIAHVFLENNRSDLEAGCILPFTALRDTNKRGTFGNVYEVTIPSSHLAPGLVPKSLLNKHGADIPAALKELSNVPADADYDIQQAWATEADALFTTRSLKTDHVVRIIGAFSRSQGQGRRYYIVLEWAQGGNLVDFWRENGTKSKTCHQIRQYIRQLTGLCQALEELHKDFKIGSVDQSRPDTLSLPNRVGQGGRHVRHGDLKPANILIFPPSNSDWLGVLKIADLGLAKIHSQGTDARPAITKTTSATRQYLAPEMAQDINKKRSRRFDIWSMGCIIFESVVWLLYGKDGLDKFWANEKQPRCSEPHSLFFTLGASCTQVNKLVTDWINHILAENERLETQPKGQTQTLIGDLLTLVRDKLLVVELETPPDNPDASVRSTAEHLHSQMKQIASLADTDDKYLAAVANRRLRQPPGDLSPGTLATPLAQQNTYSHPFNSLWQSMDDENFITNLMFSHGQELASCFRPASSNLCDRCSRLGISQNSFNTQDNLSGLRKASPACDLCRLILSSVERHRIYHEIADEVEISFRQVGSELEINDKTTGTSISNLSLCKGPGQFMGPHNVRIGLPTLPSTESSAYFTLIRSWIEDCDKNHHGCKPDSSLGPARLPTRLIEIQEDMVRVHEVDPSDRRNPEMFQYTALSHRWGDNGVHQHFKTTSDNIADRRIGVPIDTLPSMFQDAIKVTSELGRRYIWIDSMCIIQEGELCDFETEAKHMETVFHLAYCVIAASRAAGTSHKLLGTRPERSYVALPSMSGDLLYICESVDDFQHQIIEGDLNKRGWVLQERVLARRTIYLGSIQTYWECGDGVRCETLTKMRNSKEAFLGDANFPNVATKSTKGGRIQLFESLYKQYSTLEFTHDFDRPLAIAGLEQRLIRAFNTKGGYGVFQLYLGRTLLWKRGSDKALRRIDFQPEQKFQVPSWSWMAYSGAIDFVDAPFKEVDWADDLESPWDSAGDGASSTGDSTFSNILHAAAYDVHFKGSNPNIMFDCEAPREGSVVKCVVIGKEKQGDSVGPAEQRYFALIIAPRPAARKAYEYMRIGVGILSMDCILLDGLRLWVQIS